MDFKKAIKILFLAPVVMGGCLSFLALLLPAERPSWSGVLEPLVDFWTAKIPVMQPAIERSKFPFATATALALGWTLLPLQALCWLTPTLFFPIPPDTPRDGFDTLRARVKAFFSVRSREVCYAVIGSLPPWDRRHSRARGGPRPAAPLWRSWCRWDSSWLLQPDPLSPL